MTVRGLAERDVTADLAIWTISYSATADNLAAAQQSVDRDTAQIGAFFRQLGFPGDALQPAGVNVMSSTDNGVLRFTVRQRMTLRTHDIVRAQAAVRRQFELVRRGVQLEEGSGMAYTFTGLNRVKPAMVAEATKDVSRMVGDSFNSSESDDLSAWVTPQPVSDDDDSAIRQVSLDDGMSMPVVETICTPPTWKDTTDNTEVQ